MLPPTTSTIEGAPLSTPVWIVLSILRIIPSILFFVIALVTITLPTWIYRLLSISLTVTVNFSTLAFIVVACVSTVSYLIRYRYHTYARLPAEPPRKEPDVEVFPDPQGGDSKPGLSNYLDEFLSAIKVFGYLERPVFHELTRTMQTRKFVAGETLLLEDEKGFCIVVDGTVQIFVRSRREGNVSGSNSDDEEDVHNTHHQGYQLLTEVKNGAPMSSLFSILSLFTEDVKLKHGAPMGDHRNLLRPLDGTTHGNMNGDVTRPQTSLGPTIDATEAETPLDSPFASSQGEGVPGRMHRRLSSLPSPNAPGALPRVPPLTLDPSDEHKISQQAEDYPRRKLRSRHSAHPDIVARAATDSTIAIIPASAFRRLTRSYPKATAHVIQVILTRFYRVTLVTSHQYLGLTQEILKTEKLMNKYSSCDLPDFLRDAALERLKDKFTRERVRIGPEEGLKGIALHNPGRGRRRRSSTLRKDVALQAHLATARNKKFDATDRITSPESERAGVSAGDLLANGRLGGRLSFSQPLQGLTPGRRSARSPLEESCFEPRPLLLERKDSMNEDEIFRHAILECMCTAMGLTSTSDLPRPPSSEQSPRLVSFDSRRQKAVFHNAFGLMESFEGSQDGESESMMSTSVSTFSQAQLQNILEDMVDEIDIVCFQQGSVLVEQQERLPGLYYVIDGFLEVSATLDEEIMEMDILGTSAAPKSPAPFPPFVSFERSDSTSSFGKTEGSRKYRQSLFLLKPGQLAGYMPAVSGFRSFVDVTAKSDVVVGFLPMVALERLVEKYPIILLTMAKRLTALLDRLILHIDFALEYLQLSAGQVIYRQNEPSDAIYIVLNGRLRAIQEKEDKIVRVLGEFGQSDSVGELEVLTETRRPGSLHAQRDSDIAKLPKMLFNSLAQEHPAITMRMSKILARRMRALVEGPIHGYGKERSSVGGNVNPSSTVNLRTVCILPITSGVPVVEFAGRLVTALTQIGTSVVSLNQAAILNHLGRHAFNRMGKLKLSQYLADLEEKFGIVLYVADTSVQSPWTSTCITQSDCILLIGNAEVSPEIGEYERFLLTTKTTARKELVLLHSERLCPPGLTRKWLHNRMWITGGHHHIQMAVRTTPDPVHPPSKRFGSSFKQRVQVIQAEIQKYTSRKVRQTPLYSTETPFKGDFHRLARRLCGKSVGLVLGGGGARGLAHVGVIRALEEAGIPIDIVGGTSIGAFVGALYAWDAGIVPMYGRIKRFAARMGSMWRFALDLTYPSASYTTGHEFNRGIFKTFGDYLIEDFWLPFYCNTTNISKSRAEFHTNGYVWRYVRASMSLAGLLPPMCDQGSMLLDGGYIDNLTVEHMKSLGADVIFAVDVGAVDEDTPQQYGDSLSGFWSLWNRWNPFSNAPNPPVISEIQSRLAYVSSVYALERAKNMSGCHYMRPPVEGIGTLQFGSFEEVYELGYNYGKQYLAKLKEQKVLPIMEESGEERKLRRTTMARRASI